MMQFALEASKCSEPIQDIVVTDKCQVHLIRNESTMKNTILTKYCNSEEAENSNTKSFEETFERYIESKIKEIVHNPKKYPFIKIINNGK
ncbi:hypothetical protein [Streptococcus ruminantium]|nr:hypothetical protein [Streptococcus ruminantium]